MWAVFVDGKSKVVMERMIVEDENVMILGTTAEFGHGRSVAIAENERLQERLRKEIQTAAGRESLRERTVIEHKLARISQRQGHAARYVGVRKNTFDLRRASAIQNLETLHRLEVQSQKVA
jgi:Transposase DDE domain